MKPTKFSFANRHPRTTKTIAVLGVALAFASIFAVRFTSARAAGERRTTAPAPATTPTPTPAAAPAPRASVTKQAMKLPIRGYVDMHTHPMAHLGFGKRLIHGAPDEGSIVPKGTRWCNGEDFRAKNMGEAMGSCASTHGGWGTDNGCGDHLRAAIINYGLDDSFKYGTANAHGDHQHAGYPAFEYWPHQTSKAHQQMWWEWIKRAHEGGLRVMVALSVNNQLLANALNGDAPKTDRASSDLQITEIKSFVGRHKDFMEIAYSADDLRRIVGSNKLAVILGMEVDDFGGFTSNPPNQFIYGNQATKQQLVKEEIKRVYNQGVRYVFPIHLTNNVIGGSAIYNALFNFANKHNTGQYIDIQHSTDPSITYNINFAGEFTPFLMSTFRTHLELVGEMFAPCINDISCIPGKVRCCSPAFNIIKNAMAMDGKWNTYNGLPAGHINALGLTSLGEFTLQEMMKIGMIIDLDHMGSKSMNRSLQLAEGFRGGYPVNLGHNGLRGASAEHPGTERNVDAATIVRVFKLQGMFGVGTGDMTPDQFIAAYRKVVAALAGKGAGYAALGIGTDVNGMEPLPKATPNLDPKKIYTDTFTRLKTAGGKENGGRTWDYTKDGVAHYGLMNEFIRDMKQRPNGDDVFDHLWQSAERFAKMWEKCESLADGQ